MTNFMKSVHDDIANRFGLGSSSFGRTMEEHNKGRTEDEARAALGRHRRDWETPSEEKARCEREVQRETLANLKERRHDLERSDNFCHTNGRLAEITRQINALQDKIDGRDNTSEREAFRAAREQFDQHMEGAIAAVTAGFGEARGADLTRYRDYLNQTYWNVDPRAED